MTRVFRFHERFIPIRCGLTLLIAQTSRWLNNNKQRTRRTANSEKPTTISQQQQRITNNDGQCDTQVKRCVSNKELPQTHCNKKRLPNFTIAQTIESFVLFCHSVFMAAKNEVGLFFPNANKNHRISEANEIDTEPIVSKECLRLEL